MTSSVKGWGKMNELSVGVERNPIAGTRRASISQQPSREVSEKREEPQMMIAEI
jgi:hypothetical protein